MGRSFCNVCCADLGPMGEYLLPQMIAGNYDTIVATVNNNLMVAKTAASNAKSLGFPNEMFTAIAKLFEETARRGFGENDGSAVCEVILNLNKIRLIRAAFLKRLLCIIYPILSRASLQKGGGQQTCSIVYYNRKIQFNGEVLSLQRYIALLRGVNISGKNKIDMSELKSVFIKLGYQDVFTHLNSGNIVFSSDDKNDKFSSSDKIKSMIQEQFSLDIPVFLILQEELHDILCNAPDWWGTDDKAIYDNLIFVMPNFRSEIIAEKIGEPTHELEQVHIYNNVIFWSFDKAKYAKANWWKKTASIGIGDAITIRTANTLRKIATM